MNIIAVDDEILALKMVVNAVKKAVPNANINSFSDIEEALEFAKKTPIQIAFLDINMLVMSGLDAAKKLKELYPAINIVFCTGHEEYALDAFKIYSSGYLLKPVSVNDVKEAMQNLRFPVEEPKRLSIHCFGNFEAYCDGVPIKFQLTKTKEMLAYLVDRNGAQCSTLDIMAVLFEESDKTNYYQRIRRDLLKTFERLNLSDCLTVNYGGISVNRNTVDCDYFDYKDGKITEKPNEYMTQYSFAEITFSDLI